jgi:hypothetical protein
MAWLYALPLQLALALAFVLATGQLSEGRRGWVCGGVSRMDAATKPPWTGLRRPPQTRRRRP